MPARSRTRKLSIDKQANPSYIRRMLYNQLLRSRKILLLLIFATLLLAAKQFYSVSSVNAPERASLYSFDSIIGEQPTAHKLIQINDRQPHYKLYVYEGYEVASARNRAQKKLIDNLKLHDKCQQNPKTIVLDIGASLGQFGLYAASCGCRVFMFEVDPTKIFLLQKSIKANSFESRITLIQKAVSDLPPKSKVYMSRKTGSQILPNASRKSPDVYSVETISLSQFNFSSDIYLLRVDVEGYEIHVIRSCEKLFRSNRIHHVLFQYTPSGTDRVLQNDLLGYMRDILGGRRFYALHPKQPLLFGPIYNEDIDQFYTQHQSLNLERDVYVLFQDEELEISSKPYEFQSSFD